MLSSQGPRKPDPQVQRGGLRQRLALAQPVDEPRLPAVRPPHGQLIQEPAALLRRRRRRRLCGRPPGGRHSGRRQPRLRNTRVGKNITDNSWCAPPFAQGFRLPMRLVTQLGSVAGSDFSHNLVGIKFVTSLTGCKMCMINHIEATAIFRPLLLKTHVYIKTYALFKNALHTV